ncbi:MAG: TraR/DksA C4-type zinc finger protein [bacterium]|nr:TraR/DksA C4-type zinc finger protein [bacterium]
MTNSMDFFKNRLLREQETIKERLRSLEEDPIASDDVIEANSAAIDSWQATVYSLKEAIKTKSLRLLNDTEQALLKLERGSYGKCGRCGKEIDQARLQILPSASFCVVCTNEDPITA